MSEPRGALTKDEVKRFHDLRMNTLQDWRTDKPFYLVCVDPWAGHKRGDIICSRQRNLSFNNDGCYYFTNYFFAFAFAQQMKARDERTSRRTELA